jgi:hypothetical protein
MHRFVNLAYTMLKDNYTGLVPVSGDVFGAGNHGVTRAHELATQFQWLYDKYPNGNEANIWGAIDLMFKGGIAAQRDWREFFVEGVFPTVAMPAIVDRRFVHGVDLAEGMIDLVYTYLWGFDMILIAFSKASAGQLRSTASTRTSHSPLKPTTALTCSSSTTVPTLAPSPRTSSSPA